MTEFKYGLFSAFLLIVWMIIFYTLLIPNYHQFGSYVSIIAFFIPFAGIYFGIREKRIRSNFGYITFKDAFKTGMIITLIISVLMMVFVYVYYEYVNPEFLNYLNAEAQKKLLASNASRDEINAELTIINYKYSLNVQLIEQTLYVLAGGTITSAIASFFLKKTRKEESKRV
ncbi:MAG TPA: DUF4199 domain-containing protein [Ignavibacteria bacterium]|nr:DUF4199 domain-containing protein [Ignavibacteria bacterium]HMR41907.1 DUF4199 domain-containing protein [Ignavibacteria bacterium]